MPSPAQPSGWSRPTSAPTSSVRTRSPCPTRPATSWVTSGLPSLRPSPPPGLGEPWQPLVRGARIAGGVKDGIQTLQLTAEVAQDLVNGDRVSLGDAALIGQKLLTGGRPRRSNGNNTAGNNLGESLDSSGSGGGGGTVTRYMGPDEARIARESGEIPNVGRDGARRPTHVTTDPPVNSASAAEDLYEIGRPTHRATVPADRVDGLGTAPDGRSRTSGGGSQAATNNTIPVEPGDIVELDT